MYVHVWWYWEAECFGHGGNQVNHQHCSLSCTIMADIHRHGWHLLLLPMIVRRAQQLRLCVCWSLYDILISSSRWLLPCGHTVNTTVQSKCTCEHVPRSVLWSFEWMRYVSTASACALACMHQYMYACLPLQAILSVISSLLIRCGLSAGDLVESHWCLMPNELLARLRSPATFTLLAV